VTSRADAWLDALLARHTAAFEPAAFLKAVRALSARYVERRGGLPDRSPLDSAGKRAAFAAFYAPLHFFTVRELARRLAAGGGTAAGDERIVDLGCGTGAAGAAWAGELAGRPRLVGVDRHPWVLPEAAWNWRQLGLDGTTRRGDLVAAAAALAAPNRAQTTIVLGWCVNELDAPGRTRLLAAVRTACARGARIVVVEPLARAVSPWWDEWVRTLRTVDPSTTAGEWTFDAGLPPALERLNEAAGFSRRALAARVLVTRT